MLYCSITEHFSLQTPVISPTLFTAVSSVSFLIPHSHPSSSISFSLLLLLNSPPILYIDGSYIGSYIKGMINYQHTFFKNANRLCNILQFTFSIQVKTYNKMLHFILDMDTKATVIL